MLIYKIGNYNSNKKHSIPLGTLNATVEQDHANYTLKEIAEQIAKERNIIHGEIRLLNIEFVYAKNS